MRTFFIALFTCLALPVMAQPKYDVVLKNGHVIDPKNNVNEKRDVAITDGKIAAVERNRSEERRVGKECA